MTSLQPNTTVLIPAAGRVPEGVIALSNLGTSAMIPVGGRPVIHWTVRYLLSLGLTRYRIAVPRRGLFIEEYLASAFGDACDVEFIVPSFDGGVGQTVCELADGVGTASALVVLGDTYFRFRDDALLASPRPAVLVHPVEDSYRWCIAEAGADGDLVALRDKDPTLQGTQQALIGVYHFPDAKLLGKAARAAVEDARTAGRRAELAAILGKVQDEAPIQVVEAGEWLDCGNPDRQAASHRALLQARDFNELAIDPVLGTITKRSRKAEKFIDEINYLRLIPRELAVLFPRVIDYSTDWESPSLKMEYYGYPSLSEVFLFENVDPGIWEQVFRHLHQVVTGGFMRWQRPLARGSVTAMLVDKTRTRLESLPDGDPLRCLVEHPGELVVSGRRVPNLHALWPTIEKEVARIDECAEGSIIHGDLCLSNILYDLRSRIVKLVDPRGSFGNTGIYGDPRYNFAKLYHSVYGGYDFLVNDLFSVEKHGEELVLEIRSQPRHADIRQRFERVFFPSFNRKDVLLITALLFASMPPLHYDQPRRQLAMYARALELLAEYFSS